MNDDLYYIVALTGHRPQKLGGYDPHNPIASVVLERAGEHLSNVWDRHENLAVISGLALGWDQWVADLCSELSIPYAGAAPCRDQSNRWPSPSKAEYQRICRGADGDVAKWLNLDGDGNEILHRNRGVVYVSNEPYSGPECMQERNVWMVHQARSVLACFDGSSGGTANCVKYARKKDVPVLVIDPSNPGAPLMEQDSLW